MVALAMSHYLRACYVPIRKLPSWLWRGSGPSLIGVAQDDTPLARPRVNALEGSIQLLAGHGPAVVFDREVVARPSSLLPQQLRQLPGEVRLHEDQRGCFCQERHHLRCGERPE